MWGSDSECGIQLADLAVKALIDEAELTPKPGLVDRRSAGCHTDMNIELMRTSAESLHDCFAAMGRTAHRRRPDQQLRETLAVIGRSGERKMMQVTGGVNTHVGAIWALGLLIAGAAIEGIEATADQIAVTAGDIAKFADRNSPKQITKGMRVMDKYGCQGARGEAAAGFPHVVDKGLPTLQTMRVLGVQENEARLNAFLAIMTTLNDSCLLHRGGLTALVTAQQGAREVLELGGVVTAAGWKSYQALEACLVELHVSPGGSADLLAAVLFLDSLHSASRKQIKYKGELSRGTVGIYV